MVACRVSNQYLRISAFTYVLLTYIFVKVILNQITWAFFITVAAGWIIPPVVDLRVVAMTSVARPVARTATLAHGMFPWHQVT